MGNKPLSRSAKTNQGGGPKGDRPKASLAAHKKKRKKKKKGPQRTGKRNERTDGTKGG